MALPDHFRQALEDGDVALLRKIWAHAAPHLPGPKNDAEAEIAMHNARTQAESVSFEKRAYSHAWLTERALPSALPDSLKPSAERLYPRVVEGVLIGVEARNPLLKPAAVSIRKAMEAVVADAYAEGRTSPAFVKARMAAARADETRRLFGRSVLMKGVPG